MPLSSSPSAFEQPRRLSGYENRIALDRHIGDDGTRQKQSMGMGAVEEEEPTGDDVEGRYEIMACASSVAAHASSSGFGGLLAETQTDPPNEQAPHYETMTQPAPSLSQRAVSIAPRSGNFSSSSNVGITAPEEAAPQRRGHLRGCARCNA